MFQQSLWLLRSIYFVEIVISALYVVFNIFSAFRFPRCVLFMEFNLNAFKAFEHPPDREKKCKNVSVGT